MTQPALAPAAAPHPVQNAPVEAPAAQPSGRSTVADRAAALKAKLEPEDDKSLPSVGADPTAPTPDPEKPETDAQRTTAAPAADDAEKRRQERQERIARMRAKEEEANRQRQARQANRTSEAEIEKLRKRVADLEPLEQAWASPLSMLEWAEKKGHKPEDVVKVLKEKLADPEALARRHAMSAEERFFAELKKRDEKIAELEARWEAEKRQAAEQSEGQRRASEFQARVTEQAKDYPLTAAFQKRHGYTNLVAFANRWVAQDLPEDYSLEQLHDHLEQVLEELQVAGALEAPAPTTSPGQAHSGGAGQPAITLDNRTTAGRDTLVQETPLNRLSKAERVRKAREKYERE